MSIQFPWVAVEPGIPSLVSPCRWVEPVTDIAGHSITGVCYRASIGLVVCKTVAQGILGVMPAHWWMRWFPGLVAAFWDVGSGPESSGR